MESTLLLSYLALRGELTQSQHRRLQIKLGAMAQPMDQAVLQTSVLDLGSLLRLREEYKQWRGTAAPEELDRMLSQPVASHQPAAQAPQNISLARALVLACLEDALAKRMDTLLLRFDEQSRPALEILYRYGPNVRDAMAFQEDLAHQVVAEIHALAGTGPLGEARTTIFQLEVQGARRSLSLRQSERRSGKETLEIRLNP